MKIICLFFMLLSVLQIAYGQVETKYYPKGDAINQVKFIKDHPESNKTKDFPPFDIQKLIAEDKLNEGIQDLPFRFGKGFDANITLVDGNWVDIENGRLWSMEFKSAGAYSINFVFDKFYLSHSSELYIANIEGTILYGPVTSRQNTKNGHFLSDLIQGDNVIIYLFEPTAEKGESQFIIKSVVHAYKNLFIDLYGNLGGSLSCNNNIACFPAWDEASDAVALVLLSNGQEWCSGSLLMTTDVSFRPYFLSAFHCVDINVVDGALAANEITDAESWLFKFQYKMTSCNGNTATTGITYNGAEFRAAWGPSDFVLLEMNDSPVGDPQISWLGWDRSENTPTSGTGIHHPQGDVMKISFDNHNLSSNSTQITWSSGIISPVNTHWVVGFDNGTAESGSSGSPLFDQNKRVIGQLHGGQNGCAPVTKYYGQFHRSWTGGGSDDTRLSNWLDSCGLGAVTTNTSRSPYITGSTLICASGNSFTINNLPSGSTIVWSCGSAISRVSPQGSNPCTFKSTGSGSSWIKDTITTACRSYGLPAKSVWSGKPNAFIYGQDHGVQGNSYTYSVLDPYYYNYNSYMGATYTWSNPGGGCEILPYLNQANIGFYASGYITINCQLNNTCGSYTATKTVYMDPGSKSSYILSPNPTSSILTITVIENQDKSFNEQSFISYYPDSLKQVVFNLNKSTSEKSTFGSKFYIIRIYNDFGRLVYSSKESGLQFTLQLNSLPIGNYVVEINNGISIEKQKLIINH